MEWDGKPDRPHVLRMSKDALKDPETAALEIIRKIAPSKAKDYRQKVVTNTGARIGLGAVGAEGSTTRANGPDAGAWIGSSATSKPAMAKTAGPPASCRKVQPPGARGLPGTRTGTASPAAARANGIWQPFPSGKPSPLAAGDDRLWQVRRSLLLPRSGISPEQLEGNRPEDRCRQRRSTCFRMPGDQREGGRRMRKVRADALPWGSWTTCRGNRPCSRLLPCRRAETERALERSARQGDPDRLPGKGCGQPSRMPLRYRMQGSLRRPGPGA